MPMIREACRWTALLMHTGTLELATKRPQNLGRSLVSTNGIPLLPLPAIQRSYPLRNIFVLLESGSPAQIQITCSACDASWVYL